MAFEDFCSQNNIVIHYCDFTTKVKGFCMKEGSYYIVIINNKFSYQSQKNTLEHEVLHIIEDHFQYSNDRVNECEKDIKSLIGKLKLFCNEEFSADLC